ncbi:MAG: DMT family transporter [Candidatus Limiplasma sp.]|nr:DMT family transporter [Candidatus Limiplasma sp.]
MMVWMAIASGAMVALTLVQNGDLAQYLGNVHATVVVHAVGLLSLLLWLALRRVPFRWDRHTPWYGYLGGVMGVVTVLGANTCVASLGVTVPVAMMLVGQTLAGLAIDQFGFFGAVRRPLRPAHGISLLLIAAGVAVLLWA